MKDLLLGATAKSVRHQALGMCHASLFVGVSMASLSPGMEGEMKEEFADAYESLTEALIRFDKISEQVEDHFCSEGGGN